MELNHRHADFQSKSQNGLTYSGHRDFFERSVEYSGGFHRDKPLIHLVTRRKYSTAALQKPATPAAVLKREHIDILAYFPKASVLFIIG